VAAAMAAVPRSFIVGISGVSSSGKTTLARLLRDIWPRTFILHEDDFYWPDAQIPLKDGVADWDCLESIDISTLRSSLNYIKAHAVLPPDLRSKEDQNDVGKSGVDQNVVAYWQKRAGELCDAGGGEDRCPPIAVIDGFLLYSPEMKEVWDLLDLRLFLRTT